jgi:fluoride exporter
MLKTFLFIFLGGGLGSVFRYGTTLLTQKFYTHSFPLATFLVNVIGCFIIGALIGFSDKLFATHADLRFLFITGFCGGYTTFSAFGHENMNLIQNNQLGLAITYIGLSVVVGLLAVWLGLFLAK